MSILFSIFYFLFFFLAWRRLNWAVLFVIATLPSYLIRFNLGPVPMTLLEGMVLVVFVIWLIRKFKIGSFQKFSILHSPFSISIILFLLAATISIFVSPDIRAALGIWRAYFVEPILFFIVLRDLLHKRAIETGQIVFVLSISALVLSFFAIYQKFTGFWIPNPWIEEAVRRVTSVFEYPNALGLFLGPLIPLFAGRLIGAILEIRAKRDDRHVLRRIFYLGYWILVIATSLLAIWWARSTGALVGVTIALMFMVIVEFVIARSGSDLPAGRQAKQSRTLMGLLRSPPTGGSLAMTVIFFIVISVFIFKIPSVKNELLLRDWSGHVRRTQWTETVKMLKDRPILGAGLSGYPTVIAPYHKADYLEIFQYPHNIIFNFWSETGLLGLVAFILLIINFFRLGIKKLLTTNYSLFTIPTMASMVVILVHGLVDVPYFKNDLAVLFWIIYVSGFEPYS